MSTESAAPKHRIVTGSATADGAPIYLRADRGWTRRLADAHVTTDESELEELLLGARTDQATVCDPYPIELASSPQGLAPTTLRERIRQQGPTLTVPIPATRRA